MFSYKHWCGFSCERLRKSFVAIQTKWAVMIDCNVVNLWNLRHVMRPGRGVNPPPWRLASRLSAVKSCCLIIIESKRNLFSCFHSMSFYSSFFLVIFYLCFLSVFSFLFIIVPEEWIDENSSCQGTQNKHWKCSRWSLSACLCYAGTGNDRVYSVWYAYLSWIRIRAWK